MVNTNSAIALYGFEEIPQALTKLVENGIELKTIPNVFSEANLGSQLGDLVSKSDVLILLKTDKGIQTIVQFYLAANKSVYLLGDNEQSFLPKGVQVLSDIEEVVTRIFDESECAIIDTKIEKLELLFNAFVLIHLKRSWQKEFS